MSSGLACLLMNFCKHDVRPPDLFQQTWLCVWHRQFASRYNLGIYYGQKPSVPSAPHIRFVNFNNEISAEGLVRKLCEKHLHQPSLSASATLLLPIWGREWKQHRVLLLWTTWQPHVNRNLVTAGDLKLEDHFTHREKIRTGGRSQIFPALCWHLFDKELWQQNCGVTRLVKALLLRRWVLAGNTRTCIAGRLRWWMLPTEMRVIQVESEVGWPNPGSGTGITPKRKYIVPWILGEK